MRQYGSTYIMVKAVTAVTAIITIHKIYAVVHTLFSAYPCKFEFYVSHETRAPHLFRKCSLDISYLALLERSKSTAVRLSRFMCKGMALMGMEKRQGITISYTLSLSAIHYRILQAPV